MKKQFIFIFKSLIYPIIDFRCACFFGAKMKKVPNVIRLQNANKCRMLSISFAALYTPVYVLSHPALSHTSKMTVMRSGAA